MSRSFNVGDLVQLLPDKVRDSSPLAPLIGTRLVVKHSTNAGFNGILYDVEYRDAENRIRRAYNISGDSLVPLGTLCLMCEVKAVDTYHDDTDMCQSCRLHFISDRVEQLLYEGMVTENKPAETFIACLELVQAWPIYSVSQLKVALQDYLTHVEQMQ